MKPRLITLAACALILAGCRSSKQPLQHNRADLLYLSPDGTLQVGSWGKEVSQDNLAFFKFGSVVGFTNQNNEWSSDKVKYNPTSIPNSTFSIYRLIPCFEAADYDTLRIRNVSDPAYHNSINVKERGKGDPCKLVGLSPTATAEQIDRHQSGWRLPTQSENAAFVGAPTAAYISGEKIENSRFSYWSNTSPAAPADSTGGGYFPVSKKGKKASAHTKRNGSSHGFLPAAGYRFHSIGSPYVVGSNGYFWSSTPNSNTFGHYLYFYNDYLYPTDAYHYANGYAIRCVPT